ncbi:MAG: AmmeMemoRadiSam system protein B [Synergistaceae bacterium]|jgi:poly-gamma-glutamate synthesis protein (capsule biosynthesis protein)|nr:AmmeMemoRadiSam system protein B [Synergistaceae bacterium]
MKKVACLVCYVLIAAFVSVRADSAFAAAIAPGRSLRSPYEGMVLRAISDTGSFDVSPGRASILGGIVPHHDLALGMIVRFYRQLANNTPDGGVRRVWLFAPDHFRQARRWVAVCPSDWEFRHLAPRAILADKAAVSSLEESRIVEANSELFASEHGITLHIPLVAHFFPDATVVPVVFRPDAPDMALLMFRNRVLRLAKDGDLVILSMDLSHYKPPETMALEDERTLGTLLGIRPSAVAAIDVDARRAAAFVLMLFRDMGASRGELLEHTDSSALLGRRVEFGTSYATIVYRRETPEDATCPSVPSRSCWH